MKTTDAPKVEIDGDRLRVRFNRFSIDEYPLFLKAKRLPEYQIELDGEGLACAITAPSRFAPMLGVATPNIERGWLPLPKFLYDDQRAEVKMALEGKRFAVWSDCGLGKTFVEAEFARQVCHTTGGRVLILTLGELVEDYIDEIHKFYPKLAIVRIETRIAMKEWCATGCVDDQATAGQIAVTNYEKFNHKGAEEQIVSELRSLAGIVLDESSRLKSAGGKQKWALIKSARGIQYKLSCTATPAPNEYMEFASQAAFLERMRAESMGDAAEQILWTYFTRDSKTHRWTIKQHARKAFFEWMASWSIFVRDPRKYGWRVGMTRPPEPTQLTHGIAITAEQRQFVMDFNATLQPANDHSGTGQMFAGQYNAIQSTKLSQAAKGFVYVKPGTEGAIRGLSGKLIRPIESLKPDFVVKLIRSEVAAGYRLLVWCEYDEEIDLLAKKLGDGKRIKFGVLTGRTKTADRRPMKLAFREGEISALITRTDLLGYGANLQHVKSMIASGWSFSYEDWYQAWRRAVRDGQTDSVRIHVPIIPELEGQMYDAIGRKAAQHELAIAEMESHYIDARHALAIGKGRAA